MLGLELVVALGAAVVVASLLAPRIRITQPLLLVILGLALTLVPEFRGVGLPPETVLLLFLPALLYWESLTTSLREIRRFIRGIILSGTLLVVLTAAAVAAVAHALGMDWGPAWIIGAALAPTDATAVAAIAHGLLPRRQMTVLHAESLINDGTALVVYGVAVGFATGSVEITPLMVTGEFLYSFVGGVGVGVAVAWASLSVRRRIENPLAGNAATLLTPFVAYLGGELVHASAVLAVVSCGLYISQAAPLTISAYTRQQTAAVWRIGSYLLNGALFVLVGLALPSAMGGILAGQSGHGQPLGTVLLVGAAVYGTILVTRLAVLVVSAYVIRAVDRRPHQRKLRTTNRARVMSTTAGVRGAVSLAVALAVPQDYPARDVIVSVTAFVVVASLALQGSVLPRVIRWSRIPEDTKVTEEILLAKRTATEEAFKALPDLAREINVDDEVLERIHHEYDEHLAAMTAGFDDEDHPAVVRTRQYARLRLALIGHKRATVVRLRDEKTIDDTVLRTIEGELDAEEVRLARQQETE
jgi:CPA1 family monovalent cation:H+ antiporter